MLVPRCRVARARASRLLARAILGDVANVGVPSRPAGQGGCGSIGEKVDHAVAVGVDYDCAVAAALADRPIVDAGAGGSWRVGYRQAGDEPQHGRAAGRHVQVR